MIQNYTVNLTQLGAFPKGSVLPRYILEAAAGAGDKAARERVVAEMIERGVVTPTHAPVNVDLAPPVASVSVPIGRIPDEVAAELDRLRKANTALENDRDAHEARANEAMARRDSLMAEIAKYVEANSHLDQVCKELQERIAELEKELDEATAPATV